MSENATPAPAAGADAAPKKGGAGGMLVGVLLSAVLSGGAAFGGARIAGKGAAHPAEAVAAVKPPGATLVLEPFIANISDAEGKPHALKITLAIELTREMKEEEFKPFIPRIRDAVLSYLRSLTAEKLAEPQGLETIRKELIEKLHAVGAAGAEQVLVTDLISQ
jgi:flagellar FliL protein